MRGVGAFVKVLQQLHDADSRPLGAEVQKDKNWRYGAKLLDCTRIEFERGSSKMPCLDKKDAATVLRGSSNPPPPNVATNIPAWGDNGAGCNSGCPSERGTNRFRAAYCSNREGKLRPSGGWKRHSCGVDAREDG
jgi:hypothetical protein